MSPSGWRVVAWASLVVLLTFGTAVGSIFLFDAWVGQERQSAVEGRFASVLERIDDDLNESRRSNEIQEANQETLASAVDVVERVGICFVGLLLVVPEDRVLLTNETISDTCRIPPAALEAVRSAFERAVP